MKIHKWVITHHCSQYIAANNILLIKLLLMSVVLLLGESVIMTAWPEVVTTAFDGRKELLIPQFMSCIFMPCYLVRLFHVLQFHVLQFWWSVIFMSVIFSQPLYSTPLTGAINTGKTKSCDFWSKSPFIVFPVEFCNDWNKQVLGPYHMM